MNVSHFVISDFLYHLIDDSTSVASYVFNFGESRLATVGQTVLKIIDTLLFGLPTISELDPPMENAIDSSVPLVMRDTTVNRVFHWGFLFVRFIYPG